MRRWPFFLSLAISRTSSNFMATSFLMRSVIWAGLYSPPNLDVKMSRRVVGPGDLSRAKRRNIERSAGFYEGRLAMSLIELSVMYGHLEGAGKDFARDPTGYLSIEAGVFRRHGLEVSWQHVQGTEERYRRLEDGRAQLSLLVGRASLPHFLQTRSTRILGAAMNSCPYYLVASPNVNRLADLSGKVIACREGPSRGAPIAETFFNLAKLRVGSDLELRLPSGAIRIRSICSPTAKSRRRCCRGPSASSPRKKAS